MFAFGAGGPLALPAILKDAVAFWRFDDTDLGAVISDATGRGNDLTRYMLPAVSTLDFRIGANSANGQPVSGRVANGGKWNRALTAGELAALYGGEIWPFATTTSLADAVAYHKLNEAGGSATYVDATGRGNDLTKAGGNATVQVVGPLGVGFGTQFDGSNWLTRAITADLQGGNAPQAIGVWVNLASKGVTQEFFWGQFNNGTRLGTGIYYHAGNDRFQVDLGNDVDLYRNAVVVADNFGSPSINTWYFLYVSYNPSSNTLSMSVNNGTPNTLSPIQQPDRVAGKIGSGAKFQVNPAYSPASGWDLTGSQSFVSHAANADLRFGNNAKSVAFWFKLDDFTTTATLMGFYDANAAMIDWVIQISAGVLYFLTGDSAGHFDFVSRPVADTGWHFGFAWFDKDGDGKIHLVVDNGTPATPVTPTHTPASNSLTFLIGAAHSNTVYTQQLKGTVDLVGILPRAPLQADLDALWNNGNGRTR